VSAQRRELHDRVLAVQEQLTGGLSPEQEGWAAEVPVGHMVEAFEAVPPGEDFTLVTAELEALDAAVSLLAGEEGLSPYYRLVLLELVARTLSRPPELRLPESVEHHVLGDYGRISEEAASGRTWADPLTDGDYTLDVALARGTMLPFGMLVISLCEDGTMWSDLRPSAAATREYGREGFFRAFIAVADFLQVNPQYEAVHSAAWLIDPALAEISPHLAWAREELLAGGAELRPLGTADHVVANAIATSKTRRRLYEEGTYTPTAYAMVWPREELLRWADRYRR
jgi:hypothetical protein